MKLSAISISNNNNLTKQNNTREKNKKQNSPTFGITFEKNAKLKAFKTAMKKAGLKPPEIDEFFAQVQEYVPQDVKATLSKRCNIWHTSSITYGGVVSDGKEGSCFEWVIYPSRRSIDWIYFMNKTNLHNIMEAVKGLGKKNQ